MSPSATFTMKKSAIDRKAPASTTSSAAVLHRGCCPVPAGRVRSSRLSEVVTRTDSRTAQPGTRPPLSRYEGYLVPRSEPAHTEVVTALPTPPQPGIELPGTGQHAARRRELGTFLRSRRERLTPEQVGLPATTRRRTPGLRREEVAT